MTEGVHNPTDLGPALEVLDDIEDTLDEILEDLEIIDGEIEDLQDDVTLIREVTDGLPTLTETTGSTTTTAAAEYNMYINNAPLGVFNPICVKVWFLNQTAAETVILRSYSRPDAGAVWALEDTKTFVGVQDPISIIIRLLPTRYGVRTTIERTAGVARAYFWAAFYEI